MSIKGNKNAQKWTQETVLKKLQEIEEALKENPNEYHLGGVIISRGLYPQWWSEKAGKFKKIPAVNELIKRIEGTLEYRIVNASLKGDIKSAAMAIFYLKNKHGYTDKQEIKQEQESKVTIIDQTIKLNKEDGESDVLE